MLMHFVSTGKKFPYSYYIGIMSASRWGPVKLWYLEKSDSEYFDKVVKTVPSEKVTCPEFPALRKDMSDHRRLVSKFDYLIWRIVARYGGSVMGLDSITLRPFHDLLGKKEMLVGIDAETTKDFYCMHGATAVPGSKLAELIHEDSTRAMYGEEIEGGGSFRDGILRFGGAGIIPFQNRVGADRDKLAIADFGVLGGYMHDESPFYLFEDSELLNPDCRTIPFYASWQKAKFNALTEQSIKGTLLGRLVERIGI